jgi:hypothetical protein
VPYNGWKNYETWATNLWLGNDEGLYLSVRQMAREAVEAAPQDINVPDIWSVDEAARYRLADTIKDWLTNELAPDLGASLWADLLGAALSEVAWDDVAASWIEDVS